MGRWGGGGRRGCVATEKSGTLRGRGDTWGIVGRGKVRGGHRTRGPSLSGSGRTEEFEAITPVSLSLSTVRVSAAGYCYTPLSLYTCLLSSPAIAPPGARRNPRNLAEETEEAAEGRMRSKSENPSGGGGAAAAAAAASSYSDLDSIDPVLLVLKILPYSFLRPPRTRLKLPTLVLPSAMTVFSLLLLTYFAVVSGLVYDVIVEPPGIGSTQDRGAVRPVVFLPGRVNGQYIIEGLSSGFMFVLGGVGIILMDLALDRNRAKSVRVSFASFGIAAVVIAYIMSMLFIRIKIPAYLY
ncbi:hypothetical protein Taro_011220 [Colocasia esculenta]|uniref:Oligosaccharyltransferase complex subunit ostc n=1 Tax=Colocasia esculenta TaxID=4460 RepID=A0A843UA00_COLES|nr:hypothetical protein [Colocasia esculenta]